MTEAFVQIVDHGDTCGQYSVENSVIPLFKVCRDGSACYQMIDFDGGSTKRCQTVHKDVSESCIPHQSSCVLEYKCMKNAYEDYTCRAEAFWTGNVGIHPEEVFEPTFKRNEAMYMVGIVIIVMWFVSLMLFVLRKCYENNDKDVDPFKNSLS
jgi:hypothetical protein